MIRDEVVSKLKADEPHLRARGVTRLALFGSVLRGEERADSDVDILIDVDPNVKFSILDRAGLMNRLEDLLGRPVEICRRENLKPLLRDRILSEAVDIF